MSDNDINEKQNKYFNQNKSKRVFNSNNNFVPNNNQYSGGGLKKWYEEQLDTFINNNNMQAKISQKLY